MLGGGGGGSGNSWARFAIIVTESASRDLLPMGVLGCFKQSERKE